MCQLPDFPISAFPRISDNLSNHNTKSFISYGVSYCFYEAHLDNRCDTHNSDADALHRWILMMEYGHEEDYPRLELSEKSRSSAVLQIFNDCDTLLQTLQQNLLDEMAVRLDQESYWH